MRWQRWRRPQARNVMIDARTSMEYAMMAPVYKAMSEDSRVTFYFTSSEKPDRIPSIYSEVGAEARIIDPKRAALMKFDAYLAADLVWARLPRGTRRIQMFHGVAGKYGHIYDRPDRSMRQWHRLFFINRRRMQNFITSGAIDSDGSVARLIGMPKVDCLVDGSLDRDSVLRSLGLDPARRTVLYAPTWTPYSSLNAMGEEVVRQLARAGYTVIVKLHDNSCDLLYSNSGGVDWIARLGPILREAGGHLAHGTSVSPYFVAADLLITDHSSVGFEYLLLDRPLVRIEMPELITRTNIHSDYIAMLRDVSMTARNAAEVLSAVEMSFNDPGRQSPVRKLVAEELFYKPGTATERAVAELYNVLELDPP